MAKEQVLSIILWVLAAPLSILSLLLGRFGSASLQSDLESCLKLAIRFGESVPGAFVDAVFLAEDHRNKFHPGVDILAVSRAVWVRIHLGQVQGASTIEQQFVRVVTNRHERTVRRKIREQILALMLVQRISKRHIPALFMRTKKYSPALLDRYSSAPSPGQA